MVEVLIAEWLGRTEADHQITNEPWSSMPRSKTASKITLGSQGSSALKKAFDSADIVRDGFLLSATSASPANSALSLFFPPDHPDRSDPAFFSARFLRAGSRSGGTVATNAQVPTR